MKDHSDKEYTVFKADDDAEYVQTIDIDLATVPHTSDNATAIPFFILLISILLFVHSYNFFIITIII